MDYTNRVNNSEIVRLREEKLELERRLSVFQNKTVRRAIYAFSGDPITYGHLDVVKRAANMFDELVLAIGVNPDKKYLFSLEERIDMARKVTKTLSNVRVDSFTGLLVDYAKESNIPVVLKGLRDSKDFDYEMLLHQVGESQKLGISTLFLPTKNDTAHISSSAAKALQKEQGLIHQYVPLYVKQKLEERLSGQYLVGVTGEMGSGKSFLCNRLVDLGNSRGLEVHNIDLDIITHNILGNLDKPYYGEIRKKIAEMFGNRVMLPTGFVDRKQLGEIVFHNKVGLKSLTYLMYEPVLLRLRKEMYGKKGLILVNAALLAEADMGFVCNNNFVLVNADYTSRQNRLKRRGLNDEQIARRVECQYSFDKKSNYIKGKIDLDDQGRLFVVENNDGQDNSQFLFDDIVNHFNLGGKYGTR